MPRGTGARGLKEAQGSNENQEVKNSQLPLVFHCRRTPSGSWEVGVSKYSYRRSGGIDHGPICCKIKKQVPRITAVAVTSGVETHTLLFAALHAPVVFSGDVQARVCGRYGPLGSTSCRYTAVASLACRVIQLQSCISPDLHALGYCRRTTSL